MNVSFNTYRSNQKPTSSAPKAPRSNPSADVFFGSMKKQTPVQAHPQATAIRFGAIDGDMREGAMEAVGDFASTCAKEVLAGKLNTQNEEQMSAKYSELDEILQDAFGYDSQAFNVDDLAQRINDAVESQTK